MQIGVFRLGVFSFWCVIYFALPSNIRMPIFRKNALSARKVLNMWLKMKGEFEVTSRVESHFQC